MVISHTASMFPKILPTMADLIPVKSIALRSRQTMSKGKKVPISSIGTGYELWIIQDQKRGYEHHKTDSNQGL